MSLAEQAEGLKQGHVIQEFPIKQEERICTDVFCTIVGILFSLALVITAGIVFDADHYSRTSFPSDSQGRVCGYDLKYSYVYFTNFPAIKDRVCVQSCPKAGDTRLSCYPTDNIGCSFSDNPNFTVKYYPNTPQSLSIGSFCAPENEELKQQLYMEIDVSDRYGFFKQINSIIICGAIALALAVVYTLLVQFFPKLMNKLSVVLGLVFICVMLLLLVVYPTGNVAVRVVVALVLLLLVGIVGLGAFRSKACLDMHGVFLYHATQLVKQNTNIIVFVPIFLVMFTLFIIIILWEFKSLWSSASVVFTEERVYYSFKPGSTTFATAVIFIQFLWGLSFIKQSFNFCISGNAVSWYDKQLQGWQLFKPLYYLLRFHFGSVVAGSFINLFCSLFDYIFDVLRPDGNSSQQVRNSCLQVLDSFFDLVRSDAMVFVNLAGNPYCNSSRYCEALCKRSPIAEFSQSISRSYRICSHLLLAGLVATISFFLQGEASVFIVLIVFVMSLFLSTFLISLHADAAEAIQIIFLLDVELARQGERNKNKHDIPNLKLRNRTIADQYHRESEQVKQKVKEALKDQLK